MQSAQQSNLRPSRKGHVRLSPVVIARAKYLLPTDYRSSQLATELGLDRRETWRVREWCRRGLPHRHDATGHVVINGAAFVQWAHSIGTRHKPQRMPDGHMWCCACNCPQPAADVRIVRSPGRARKIATCPRGHTMSQWVSSRSHE